MNMNSNDNNNNNGGHNGNKGKFSDRLKKIRRDRLNKRINDKDIEYNENILIRGSRNVLKIVLAIPSVTYSVIKSSVDDINGKSSKRDKIKKNKKHEGIFIKESENESKKIKVNKIKEINTEILKKKKKEYLKEKQKQELKKIAIAKELFKEQKKEEDRKKIEKLQKEIINLIKKKLVKNINELEILQSELFVLKEVNGDSVYLQKCEEDIKEIKRLLSKINALKEKYDYLKQNVDFEYLLEYGDDLLIDKILELKDLCSREDIAAVIDDYKILDEFKFLYLKIDKLQEHTIKYDDHKKEKEEELKERDINFEELKHNVYDVDKENERYESFVKNQEYFLKDLEGKVSKIDSHEEVFYKIVGFNKLVGNSFKYMGLLLMSPLKGLFPGIATQTLITRNIIHNLYENLELQENKKMVYTAIDYSDSIKIAMNNMDSMLSLVNSTLDDVVKLKEDYKNKFSKYQFSIPGYNDTIKKINKMENAVLGSKVKLELMKQKMKEKEKQNENKMKKVKKLNRPNNN